MPRAFNRAKLGAVAIAKRMVHDGGRQAVVLNQDKRVRPISSAVISAALTAMDAWLEETEHV